MAWKVKEGIKTAEDGGSLLLLSPDGHYFGLDAIGAVIWRALEKQQLEGVFQDIASRYRVQQEVVARDADALLIELKRAGLVEEEERRA
jgi:hypothetical protein